LRERVGVRIRFSVRVRIRIRVKVRVRFVHHKQSKHTNTHNTARAWHRLYIHTVKFPDEIKLSHVITPAQHQHHLDWEVWAGLRGVKSRSIAVEAFGHRIVHAVL